MQDPRKNCIGSQSGLRQKERHLELCESTLDDSKGDTMSNSVKNQIIPKHGPQEVLIFSQRRSQFRFPQQRTGTIHTGKNVP